MKKLQNNLIYFSKKQNRFCSDSEKREIKTTKLSWKCGPETSTCTAFTSQCCWECAGPSDANCPVPSDTWWQKQRPPLPRSSCSSSRTHPSPASEGCWAKPQPGPIWYRLSQAIECSCREESFQNVPILFLIYITCFSSSYTEGRFICPTTG